MAKYLRDHGKSALRRLPRIGVRVQPGGIDAADLNTPLFADLPGDVSRDRHRGCTRLAPCPAPRAAPSVCLCMRCRSTVF